MEKLHNIVYKTTNLTNNKIYIGVHCTDDLGDGYMGSGKLLKHAFKKHGKENFKRTILHDFIAAEHAYGVEAVLVDEYFISREDTYNILKGGRINPTLGISPSEETRDKWSKIRKGKEPWNKGKTGIYSDETLLKMKTVKCGKVSKRKGTKCLKETCVKIGLASKGRIPWNKGLKYSMNDDSINKAKSYMIVKVLNK
jgi:group I intron endonuclease